MARAASIAVLTGAGISAESGIPTFRGPGGAWEKFRLEDVATRAGFDRDPVKVWQWYGLRRATIDSAQPNAGHRALAELEPRTPRFTLVTQNIDGLHQRAGNRNVLEIHGNIWTLRCTRCHREWLDSMVPLPLLPRCECGGLARPAVVWFGELLPQDVWNMAEQATANSEVFLVVGTSAVVYPAAGLIELAHRSGARVIEVNTEPTAMSAVADCSILGAAGEILPRLLPQNT
jgi:NAD-dependent deacetylase